MPTSFYKCVSIELPCKQPVEHAHQRIDLLWIKINGCLAGNFG
jgi:hypothetical protein